MIGQREPLLESGALLGFILAAIVVIAGMVLVLVYLIGGS